MLPLLAGLIGPVSGLINKILDKTVEDKDLKTKLKAEAMSQLVNQDNQEFIVHLKEASSIIQAEVKSDSWMAKNWRPVLMLTCVAIIANNYIIFPYLSMFTDKTVILELPNWLFQLMKIGVGGYVCGRSAEKIMEVYRGGKNKKS